MDVTLDTLFANPNLYFMSLEPDYAQFVAMNRDSFEKSIFFDQRIVPGPEQKVYRIPLPLMLEEVAQRGFRAPRLNVIHQVAQCGSTLLARALDRPGRTLVVREPNHLRQLGVLAGGGFELSHASMELRGLIGLSLTMLGKREFPDEPIVVKGNVPTAMIADMLADADPEQRGIMLHLPLVDYAAAVMRTEDHKAWLNGVTRELRLDADPLLGDLSAASIGERCGALWLSLMTRFARLQDGRPAFRSLDANTMFADPAATIGAAAAHFGIDMGADEAREIAEGPLFSTYAKNPSMPYEKGLREQRRADAVAALGPEIDDARRFVEARLDRAKLPDALPNPLLGSPSALL